MNSAKPCYLQLMGTVLSFHLQHDRLADSHANDCSAPECASRRVAKESTVARKICRDATAATHPIARERLPQALQITSWPMSNSHDATTDSESTLKRICLTQITVGLSTLASMAVLLVQVVPPLMQAFP